MARVPGSSIVKRDAKLLESKRPVIPECAGAETNIRDQFGGLNGLGLHHLLSENPPEPKVKVLLRCNVPLAILPASNIAERSEKHPESQLPILPSGTVGQTSCRDQVQSTDGVGPSLPLQENRPEPKHKIFLSHSGAQKSFVKQLCKDIERYDRYPFFDVLRTSLSIGCHFPKAIFEAIDQCQVAVVVLSEDFFFRTKWPMLELSALVKRQGADTSLILMPVFLGLTREQCLEKANHDRWLSLWERWAKEDPRIVLDDWKAVFKVFGYTNGVSLRGLDEVQCREEIVDAICKEVPPETRRDDSHVQGRMHMCKTIGEKLGGMELSKLYKVCVLGLYGMGGIGKSTACMTLCNHYFEEFHGRVCHVEFGVGDELHMLREILKRLTDTKHEQIDKFNLDECKHKMRDIKNQRILLAMDNVSESHKVVQQAKLILKAGFARNSIVIVTARGIGELQNLNIEESECMELPELSRDDAISLFVREVSCSVSTDEQLIGECVKKCYFSKGVGLNSQYHPLALQVLGGQLGSDSSEWLEKLEEIDVFNQYRENHNEHPIFSILRRSFDILNDEDKLLFMDCALFARNSSFPWSDKGIVFKWLSMMHGKQIKSRLNGLRRKSVIQTLEEGTSVIGIHDLWREFCVLETKDEELKSHRWIYVRMSGSNGPCTEESNIFNGVRKQAQRVLIMGELGWPCNVHLNLRRCSCLGALHLKDVRLQNNLLDLNGLYNLRSLTIDASSQWKIHGLRSLSELRLLEWSDVMPSNMACIEEIDDLTNLQILNLVGRSGGVKLGLPNLSNLSSLQQVALHNFKEGVYLSFTTTMSNLQQLHLQYCKSLRKCNGLSHLIKLEELTIFSCPNLEELSDLQAFKSLKKLSILHCSSMQRLLGVSDTMTRLELEALNLVELANLSKLTNLQVLKLKKCSLNRVVMELRELINLRECCLSFDAIGDFSYLQNLTKLKSLNVEGWSLEGSLGVDSLVNLEDLCIRDCRGIETLGGVFEVPKLCKLTLMNCNFKDVACLKDLIGLQEVIIFGCNLLEIFPNMHKASRLESITISYCSNFRMWEGLHSPRATSTEAIGIDLHSGGTYPRLQNLRLMNLTIIELPDLSNFPKLTILVIIECSSLTHLTNSMPMTSFEFFYILDCGSLTTIPNWSGCKHLRDITMHRSGVTLSESEIKYLRSLCPTIVIDIS